jgi:hypothetical protein
MLGRELNLPVDLLLGRLSGNCSNSGMISDYGNNLSDNPVLGTIDIRCYILNFI